VIIWALQGLPGSGKSTWAAANASLGQIVSIDDLRDRYGVERIREERMTAVSAILATSDVIIDGCHVSAASIADAKWLAAAFRAELRWVRFGTPIEECIRRDSLRRTPIGEYVIRSMARRWDDALARAATSGGTVVEV
jgi:predicted kinase